MPLPIHHPSPVPFNPPNLSTEVFEFHEPPGAPLKIAKLSQQNIGSRESTRWANAPSAGSPVLIAHSKIGARWARCDSRAHHSGESISRLVKCLTTGKFAKIRREYCNDGFIQYLIPTHVVPVNRWGDCCHRVESVSRMNKAGHHSERPSFNTYTSTAREVKNRPDQAFVVGIERVHLVHHITARAQREREDESRIW